jgi:putative ABC transport system substrate-binding protein
MIRREFITLLGSTAVAWPLVGRAQQASMPVIGYVSAGASGSNPQFTAAFRAGLAETDFVEGRTVMIEYRWAAGHLERLPALVVDLVRRQVAAIFTTGGDVPALVAKGATATIPIVFATGADPVKSGLVGSLNRPGGNATGATLLAGALGAKRLELVRELVPKAGAIGILVNPDNPNSEPEAADVQVAARAVREQIHVLQASNEQEIDKAFATLSELKAVALLVNPDPAFMPRRSQFAALAARYSVPAIYYSREYAEAGGLMSYGASFVGLYRQCGNYVGRILKGAKPGDLPVVQPTKFELVINLKTARALGLTVPPTLLARADEVIE